jgi:hypothetical protein
MIPVCSLEAATLLVLIFVFLPADAFLENYIYFTTLPLYYGSLARSCLENCFCPPSCWSYPVFNTEEICKPALFERVMEAQGILAEMNFTVKGELLEEESPL